MNNRLALGIDIGGTNTSFGIVNTNGDILVKSKMPTVGHDTPAAFVTDMARRLQPMFDSVGRDNLVGAGVGAPNGNVLTGEIVFAPNLPWTGVIPLAKMIADATGLRTMVTNDANAAAIGEMKYGAVRGMKDFIMVTLGTGLGSGFVANGQMIYGHDGLAGELGHVIAVRDGRKCNCGRNGCLERYASATGIVITAEEWLATRTDETTLRHVTGKIEAKTIQDAAHAGDTFALELYDYTAKILGQSLADAVAITSPKAIVFFGGVARAGDLLLRPLHRHLEENLLPIYRNKVELLQSALPDADAAILGASALVW